MHHVYACVPGSDHTAPGQPHKINKQDAIAIVEFKEGFVAVICDGCGSAPNSEVGADFGAHVLSRQVAKLCSPSLMGRMPAFDWNAIGDEFVNVMKAKAQQYSGTDDIDAFERVVFERFLFTAIIVVQWKETTIVAACGDGFVQVDDKLTVIEPPLPNAPPYLGYRLLRDTEYSGIRLRRHLAIKELMHINHATVTNAVCVGSDGALPLASEEELFHPVMLLDQDRFRRTVAGKTAERLTQNGFSVGLCHDDATLIIIRSPKAQKALEVERGELKRLKDIASHAQATATASQEALAPLRESIAKLETEKHAFMAEVAALNREKIAQASRHAAEVSVQLSKHALIVQQFTKLKNEHERLKGRLDVLGIPKEEFFLNRMLGAIGMPYVRRDTIYVATSAPAVTSVAAEQAHAKAEEPSDTAKP